METETAICKVCGDQFDRPVKRKGKHKRECCSKTCREEAKQERHIDHSFVERGEAFDAHQKA